MSSQIELGIHISARTYSTISGNGQTASLKEAMMSINLMHAKPDLRVFLEWMITGSGSVITDVIRLT